MRVSEAMTREVRVANAGAMPVGDNDRLVGMITDRDIAIRAVAQGKGPDTLVRDVMSTDKVLYCYDDEELDHVAKNMSLGNLAQTEARSASKAVKGVTKPGGAHKQ